MSELPQRKRLPHTPPPRVGTEAVFFITVCCGERRTAGGLCQQSVFDMIRQTAQVHIDKGNRYPQLMVLMPDHLHGLIQFGRDVSMRATVSAFKRYIARHGGVEWQRDFFDHRIRDDENLHEKREYILANPVRKGFAKTPEDWPYVLLMGENGKLRAW